MSDTTQAQSSDAVLSELANFSDHFTDKEKAAQLVDWLVEETGTPKLVAKLAVSRVVPFVISKVENLAADTGKAWLGRAHEYLQSRSGLYFNLTQGLLDILITKTGAARTMETAFKFADSSAIQDLLNDGVRWDALKPEQQGLIQLLNGQNDQQHLLLEILRQFEATLPLEDAEQRITDVGTENLPLWLTYSRRQAEFVGRDALFTQLDAFRKQDKSLSWWCITGAGGTGKTRFALEALLKLPIEWQGGFLSMDQLPEPHQVRHWQPGQPTLIVIDYAASHSETLQSLLDLMHQQQDNYRFPVRLLLLERFAANQPWWDSLISGSEAALKRLTLRFAEPAELEPLPFDSQRTLLQNFLNALDCPAVLPEVDSDYWQQIQELTNKGKPIFLGMLALSITDKGLYQVRNWNQGQLLQELCNREKKRWAIALTESDAGCDLGQFCNLLAFSYICGGIFGDVNFDIGAVAKTLQELTLIENETQLEKLEPIIEEITGNRAGYLQPDLFAEFFALQLWQSNGAMAQRRLARRINMAYKLAGEVFTRYLKRAATDFQDPSYGISAELQFECFIQSLQKGDQTHFESESKRLFEVVENLDAQVTISWLTSYCEGLPFSDPQRAKYANMLGMRYLSVGNHPEAIKCIEESLSIRERIGDASHLAVSYFSLTKAYIKAGDPKASEFYEKTSDIAKDSNPAIMRALSTLKIGK